MPRFYKGDHPEYDEQATAHATFLLRDKFPKEGQPPHLASTLIVETNEERTSVLFRKPGYRKPIGIWEIDELQLPRHQPILDALAALDATSDPEPEDPDEDKDSPDEEEDPPCMCGTCRRERGETTPDEDKDEPEGDPMTPSVPLTTPAALGPIESSRAGNATPWELVTFALDARTPRLMLSGPPGTGKTMTSFLWAKANGWECLSTTLTEDTPMTELRGHFVLKGHDFVWHDGLIARAWRMSHSTPVMVILNEIDHASGDTSTFLHNALDDPEMARLDLPNDETITPKAGNLMYVSTMNGTPEDLSDALRDRFPVRIHLQDPNPAAIAALPPQLQSFAQNLAKRPDLTLRGLYEFARLMKTSPDLPMAARLIFGDAYADIVGAVKMAE